MPFIPVLLMSEVVFPSAEALKRSEGGQANVADITMR
jgi:hypothetical protein